MKRNKLPVRFTGQHFTVDKVLIADAIKFAEIKAHDTVLDIGAGKGHLTIHLTKQCSSIVAIENDKYLLGFLRKTYDHNPKVKIIGSDFRKYSLPASSFKVVSNIPFRITSDILKTLMFEKAEFFQGGSLVMQLEPAQKLISDKKFNAYTVFYQTYFDINLIYKIAPDSFMPPPKVATALLSIKRKKHPKVDVQLKKRYLDFLLFVLGKPEAQLGRVLKSIFQKKQIKLIAVKHNLKLKNKVLENNPTKWSECFNDMLMVVPERYHPK
jgi:23S rRNA (adenine-N6)-dimethyltransferase